MIHSNPVNTGLVRVRSYNYGLGGGKLSRCLATNEACVQAILYEQNVLANVKLRSFNLEYMYAHGLDIKLFV